MNPACPFSIILYALKFYGKNQRRKRGRRDMEKKLTNFEQRIKKLS
jgi:hypothetical protein